jgi:hypothetical protein
MRRRLGLLHVGARPAGPGVDPRRALAEARLREAWPFVVGPALARRTRLLALQRGVLVIGCWDLRLMASLRQAAEGAWPQVQRRLAQALNLHASSVQVLPCDPPPPEPTAPPRAADPLAAALARLKEKAAERARRGWE